MLNRLRRWARLLKGDILTLWFCCRHPGMPRGAKLLAILLVAYAFSPIDLIPDFIPVLGYLDDVIILPIGIWLVLKMVPPAVIAECRAQAAARLDSKIPRPRNYPMMAAIIVLWGLLLWLAWRWLAA
jgi:uncharacterized membrane protein YkvA (DUF1232 family)